MSHSFLLHRKFRSRLSRALLHPTRTPQIQKMLSIKSQVYVHIWCFRFRWENTVTHLWVPAFVPTSLISLSACVLILEPGQLHVDGMELCMVSTFDQDTEPLSSATTLLPHCRHKPQDPPHTVPELPILYLLTLLGTWYKSFLQECHWDVVRK